MPHELGASRKPPRSSIGPCLFGGLATQVLTRAQSNRAEPCWRMAKWAIATPAAPFRALNRRCAALWRMPNAERIPQAPALKMDSQETPWLWQDGPSYDFPAVPVPEQEVLPSLHFMVPGAWPHKRPAPAVGVVFQQPPPKTGLPPQDWEHAASSTAFFRDK